jgi:glycosyltransferase involved in cell wall biosynthesis
MTDATELERQARALAQRGDVDGAVALYRRAAEAWAAVPRPFVSVCVPTYNRARFLPDALDSVLRQPFADFEIVVVDDGSTDDTPAVIARYADPRVRAFRQPQNSGRSRARNRAVSEARGEFVLWLADDDVLVEDTLTRYARVISEDPGLDIVYGNLQLFDDGTGEDIIPYEPNDWTGREDRLPGAFLHGSCLPDGGSLIRRALYDRFGLYDDEFVRAQDYEFWTRVVGHVRVRKVDGVVYLYRKHDANVSFGHGIDLSYDSKIIRRHVARRALSELFPDWDWSDPGTALVRAWLTVARCLREYQDPYNAVRFLEAIPGRFAWDEAVERWFDGLLALGAHDRVDRMLAEYAAWLPRPHALHGALAARRDEVRAALTEMRRGMDAGRWEQVAARVDAFAERFGLGFDVAYVRGRVCEARGDDAAALRHYLQAARLDPLHAEVEARASALVRKTGGRGDPAAMRRRLLDDVFPLAPADPRPAAHATGPLVSVIAFGADAVRSALAQTYANLEVLVVGDAPVTDPRVRAMPAADAAGQRDAGLATARDGYAVAADAAGQRDAGPAAARDGYAVAADWAGQLDAGPAAARDGYAVAAADRARQRNAGLAAARGAYVAWLDERDVWYADHVARLVARLEAGARAAFADAWTATLRDGRVVEQAPPATLDLGELTAERLLAAEDVPLSAVLLAREEAPAFDPALGGQAARDFLVRVARRAPLAHVHAVTVEAARADSDPDRRRDLSAFFRRHAPTVPFDRTVRDAWCEALRPPVPSMRCASACARFASTPTCPTS